MKSTSHDNYYYYHHHHHHHHSQPKRTLWSVIKIALLILLIPTIIPVGLILLSVLLGLLGVGVNLLSFFPMAVDFMIATPGATATLVICILLIIGLPILFIFLSIRQHARTPRYTDPIVNWTIIGIWLVAILMAIVLIIRMAQPSGGIKATIFNYSTTSDLIDPTKEVRNVDEFVRIVISGGIEVEVKPDSTYRVEVESMDMSTVETYVQDQVLYISIPEMRYQKAKVEVGLPKLRAIRGNGACDVDIEDIVTDSLDIEFNGVCSVDVEAHATYMVLRQDGAGHMTIEGSAQQVYFYTNGAGRLDAEDLVTQFAHVNTSGSSTIVLDVQQELWVQAADNSRVRYKGHPDFKEKLILENASVRRN